MKVLVTGATGHIGSTVVRLLTSHGDDVRGTDAARLREVPIDVSCVDLLDRKAVESLAEGCEAVVHLANGRGWDEGNLCTGLADNVTMNINVFEAARRAGVKRIIFSSSVHTINGITSKATLLPHAKPPYIPIDENLPPIPSGPYGIAKLCCEYALRYLANQADMVAVALRLPFVPHNERLPNIRKGLPESSVGAVPDGFSYLPVDDCARLIELLLRAPLEGYHCYFPAAFNNILQRPLDEMIEQYYPDVPLRVPRDQLRSLVDLRRLERDLGWVPNE